MLSPGLRSLSPNFLEECRNDLFLGVFDERAILILLEGQAQLFLVFMTMGPYQATGSRMGRPETRRKRSGLVAETATSSPFP